MYCMTVICFYISIKNMKSQIYDKFFTYVSLISRVLSTISFTFTSNSVVIKINPAPPIGTVIL